jgi:hypothetical protein
LSYSHSIEVARGITPSSDNDCCWWFNYLEITYPDGGIISAENEGIKMLFSNDGDGDKYTLTLE